MDTFWLGPNDEPLLENPDRFVLLPNGDLIVRDLTFSDMGMFKCLARNEFGEDMKEAFVYPLAAVRTI